MHSKNLSFEKINVSIADARVYLDQLDLSYIIATMCSSQYPLPRWSEGDATHCLKLYKNFLFLNKNHPTFFLVPSRDIDEFWHNHILYTQNYFQDCQHIFGHYFHHQPASPGENPKSLIDDYLKTKQLYLEAFGEPLELMVRA